MKRLREAKGYSYGQLSYRSGLSGSYLHNIEHSKAHPPKDKNIEKIADALSAKTTLPIKISLPPQLRGSRQMGSPTCTGSVGYLEVVSRDRPSVDRVPTSIDPPDYLITGGGILFIINTIIPIGLSRQLHQVIKTRGG